jgi:hypothetical protein
LGLTRVRGLRFGVLFVGLPLIYPQGLFVWSVLLLFWGLRFGVLFVGLPLIYPQGLFVWLVLLLFWGLRFGVLFVGLPLIYPQGFFVWLMWSPFRKGGSLCWVPVSTQLLSMLQKSRQISKLEWNRLNFANVAHLNAVWRSARQAPRFIKPDLSNP